MTVQVIHEVSALRQILDRSRAQGLRVGVVPTMGALHEGHLSLVRMARRSTDLVVVTIFVNPTQFGPNEDYERYPRDLSRDTSLVADAGAAIVFAPSVEQMYPKGEETRVTVEETSRGLCGAHRPGHFTGVATVVAKLFNAVGPGFYVFGMKDYQQLRVIERMARDLLFPVQILKAPIVREADGLAMSSRNVYLSPEEREVAPGLSRALFLSRSLYQKGQRQRSVLLEAARQAISRSARDSARLQVEYLELRDADSLSPDIVDENDRITPPERPVVLLVAARLGTTRLIDNLSLVE